MDQVAGFYFHAIQQVKISKWYNSRVICLGDAAYALTLPISMSISLAIIGVYVLADEFSNLSNGEYPSKALQDCERIFRPSIEKS